jgi:glycosyltransferase involved in cell wall biosynthesis
VALYLLSGLDRRKWKPVLFHHGEPGVTLLVKAAAELGVATCRVPPLRTRSEARIGLPSFFRTIREARPTVFHAHLTTPMGCKYGLLAAALARVPGILGTVHLVPATDAGFRYALSQRLITACVQRYIAVSRSIAERLLAGMRVPRCKVQVIQNGIPLGSFGRSGKPVRPAGLPGMPSRPLVLTVARLDGQKGHTYLLQAAQRIPEVDLVFVGDGPRRMELECQARALGLGDRVHFLGFRSDVPDLLAACDMFVLPSLWEGLPLAVLEAMAARKPVVATAIGGTDETVAHGVTGILVPPADPAALANAIRSLVADPEASRRLGEAGRARVEHEFSVETMMARVEAVYQDLLGPHGSLAGARS